MKESEQPGKVAPLVDDFGLLQSHKMAADMNHWLELFDTVLSHQELPLSQRPLRALTMLFVEGAIEVKAEDKRNIDPSNLSDHAEATWFRVLYEAVKYWYVERFGEAAMKGSGNEVNRPGFTGEIFV